MPWRAERSDDCPADRPWAVVQADTGEVVACHRSEAGAMEQVRALYAAEDDLALPPLSMRWPDGYDDLAADIEAEFAGVLSGLEATLGDRLASGRPTLADVDPRAGWASSVNQALASPLTAAAVAGSVVTARQLGGVQLGRDAVNQVVGRRLDRLAGSGDAVWRDLSASIGAGLDAGEDMEGLQGRLSVTLGEWRAARVGITEAVAGVNDAATRTAVAIGATAKTWFTQRDERVRDAHASLDSMTVPVTEAFPTSLGPLRYPGDPLAPAALTVNCRCWLVWR